MEWFEEWFDSPLYEKLYANRDEAEAKQLIELLENFFIKNNCKKILGIACGRGRHAITLAEKGYDVTAFDLSERAIEVAKENARKRNIENVNYMVHDMREPLDLKFDAVLNLFTSFGYFKNDNENTRIFDNVETMLRPGGIFIIDYLNADKVEKDLVKSENGSFYEMDYHIERYIENGAVHKNIHFKKGEEQKTYSERVKLYGLPWFEKELQKRGLSIEHAYGDYQGSDFDEMTSPRLLIVSRLKQV